MKASETVLVTGGNGFIGSHLVRRLITNGNRVVCLVRCGRSIDIAESNSEGIEVVTVDDFSGDGLVTALQGRTFDTIFHLAAYGVRPSERDPRLMTDINVIATTRLLGLAAKAGCGRFVMAGSSAEYAQTVFAEPIIERSPLETRALYGASKAAASLLVSALCQASGMSFAVLRLFNVFGPGEASHRLLPSILAGVAAGQRVSLSQGTQVRDFVFVEDAVDCLLAVASGLDAGPEKSGIYNCASGVGLTVRRFAELVGEACGAAPGQLSFGDVAMRHGELPYLVGSPSTLHRAMGWQPCWDVAESIRQTVAASYAAGWRPGANTDGTNYNDRS